jgi:hypothetical protein
MVVARSAPRQIQQYPQGRATDQPARRDSKDGHMKARSKQILLVVITTVTFLVLLQARGGVSGQSSGQPEVAAWEPAALVQNSTLKAVVAPPAAATLNAEYTWVLEWKPDRYIYPGTQIELRNPSFSPYYFWKFTRMEMEGGAADITFRCRAKQTSSELFPQWGKWIIMRARLQYGLRENESLRIRLTAVPPFAANFPNTVTLWYSEPDRGNQPEAKEREFTKDPRAQVVLQAGPGTVQRFAIYSQPTPGPGGKVRTVLDPEDRYGNPTEFQKAIPVELKWNGKTWTEQVKGSKIIQIDAPRDIDRLKGLIPMKALAVSENVSNGLREGGRLVVTGNPVWAVSPGGQLAAFGEFHWHTEISGDGVRSLPDGLTYARDHLNMDYISPSDHTPGPAQWKYTVSVLNRFNDPDRFATFFGYEYSTNRGHENYYFTNPEHPVSPASELWPTLLSQDDLTLRPQVISKYDTANDRFLAIPHHTNAVAETYRLSDNTPYWFQYPWTVPTQYHRLVEILQTRSNMERDSYPGDAWRGWYMNGASAQDGLAHGYKLGFTAGTDNHMAYPGNIFSYEEDAGRTPVDSIALTGLWTGRIERGKVFDALYARHTWAVWDTRALVYFTVNGAQAGEEVEVKKGEPLTARIKMSAEDALQSIEIVSEKEPMWVASEDNLDMDTKAPLGRADHSTHFYLRALQRNGGIIYASPVFVTVK